MSETKERADVPPNALRKGNREGSQLRELAKILRQHTLLFQAGVYAVQLQLAANSQGPLSDHCSALGPTYVCKPPFGRCMTAVHLVIALKSRGPRGGENCAQI